MEVRFQVRETWQGMAKSDGDNGDDIDDVEMKKVLLCYQY